jgi:outer membrane receptor for ferrienterochelin and colicins
MGDDIQIQGVDNKYILILIDGERLVGERTEKVNFSRLNVADVRQVEIVNGASSALYGSNAIGAVINIITSDVERPLGGSLRWYESDHLRSADAVLGVKVDRISGKTSFAHKDMGRYEVRGTSFVSNPYEDYSVSQTVKYAGERLTGELKGGYYNQENWLLDKNQTRVDANYTWRGNIRYVFSPKNVLTVSGYSDSYAGKLVYKLRGDSSVRSNESQYNSFRLTDVWTAGEKIQVVGGIEANFENVFSYNQFATQRKRYASNWNLFAQAEYRSGRGWEMLAGGRYVQHSQFGGYLAPNVSVMYKWDLFRFRGNVSNGFKAPTLKELYMEFPHYIGTSLPFWVVGNVHLAPEKSWYKALSAEYAGNLLSGSVTVYDNSIHNKINTLTVLNEDVVRTEMRYENVESARVAGVEVALQYNFLKRFSLRGGYALADATDRATGQQLPGNSRHTATASLSFRERHFPFIARATRWSYNLLLSARAMSPRTVYTESNGEVTEMSTGGYQTLRLVYTQQFPLYKDLRGECQLGINNLTDRVSRDFAEYNPGRTYFVSIGLKY